MMAIMEFHERGGTCRKYRCRIGRCDDADFQVQETHFGEASMDGKLIDTRQSDDETAILWLISPNQESEVKKRTIEFIKN
jgi:hypothetical protein